MLTITEQLNHAARFSSQPTFSLFAYRDGTPTLVLTTLDAAEMAAEYKRYCLNGQWGDCLEIRCNGRRIPLA